VWSQRASGLTDRAAATAAAGALVGYVAELVGRKRRAPGEDVLSDLLTAEDGGLGEDSIAFIGAALSFAGHETTVVRIDIGALLLMAHPDQRDLLRRDPDVVPRAVERSCGAPHLQGWASRATPRQTSTSAGSPSGPAMPSC
jgi:cytochrome P450